MSAQQGRRVHPALVVMAVVGCLHLFFIIGVELDRRLVHDREVARLESDVAALRAELGRLEEVASRADDRAFREALARAQGFVYLDEQLVVTAPSGR